MSPLVQRDFKAAREDRSRVVALFFLPKIVVNKEQGDAASPEKFYWKVTRPATKRPARRR
jgi:hypothetical protein